MEISALEEPRAVRTEEGVGSCLSSESTQDGERSETSVGYESALDKLREFIAIGYPATLLRSICNLLARTTSDSTWVGVRNSIDYINTARLARA